MPGGDSRGSLVERTSNSIAARLGFAMLEVCRRSKFMMRPSKPVGIVGYGVYIPRYRIAAREIARIWTDGKGGVPVDAKSVPGPDEDTITMAIEAARSALARAGVSAAQLSAVWVGSESHPYAVKPSGTIVAEALGATPWVS